LWHNDGAVSVTIVKDQRFQAHDQGPGHPESPLRLAAIEETLGRMSTQWVELAPRDATREELLTVHTPAYLDELEAARGRTVRLDADTKTSPGSVDAAYLAAGSTIDLAKAVATKKAPPGIALVRPPGHHALPDRAMGFCLLNNVAIAARALINGGFAERIAIYDWDVHHGNGTQDMFYDDPRVLYMSTHQWPFYPGTGDNTELGAGKGLGATLNVPLPAGTGDQLMMDATNELLAPKVRNWKPDLILISAGFDPFVDDPLGGFRVTDDGFKELAQRWRALAEEVCDGKIAAVLEGGYDLRGLGACVRGLVEAWDT
jgi:acetoin utilization deacetylase AcuC-like enzyme